MDKLTLLHINHFQPHQLRFFNSKSGKIFEMMYCYDNGVLNIHGTGEGEDYDFDNWPGLKPILRPYNLFEPIFINRKSIIPICEIGKILTGDNYTIWKDINDNPIGVRSGNKTIQHKDTIFMLHIDNKPYGFNALKIFNFLYQNKFDIDDLIERELAQDATKLEINPYEKI